MKNKLFLNILIVIVIGLAIYAIVMWKKPVVVEPVVVQGNQPIELCFARTFTTQSGLVDRTFLRMDLSGGNVTGDFRMLPAEKDSKQGVFSGTVTDVDPRSMSRLAVVWWEASAEGTTTTEELRVRFGEGTASIGFGEMVDRGDGAYVYKDPNNISYSLDLNDVACDSIQ